MKGITVVQFQSGQKRKVELHWYEAHGIGSSSKRKRRTGSEFAVCIENSKYPASLELRKIYRVLPDNHAYAEGLLRVIDESGEDYLYPEDYFLSIRLPKLIEKAVLLGG